MHLSTAIQYKRLLNPLCIFKHNKICINIRLYLYVSSKIQILVEYWHNLLFISESEMSNLKGYVYFRIWTQPFSLLLSFCLNLKLKSEVIHCVENLLPNFCPNYLIECLHFSVSHVNYKPVITLSRTVRYFKSTNQRRALIKTQID